MKKEKETILEKAKRKANSAKEKVVDFVDEHRAGIYVAGLTAIGIGGSVLFGKGIHKLNVKARNLIEDEVQLKNQVLGLMEKGSQWREEDYRQSWDKVNELAETLKMQPGEEYIITAPGTYVGQDEMAVSHMVDGTGVYPPDDDCNQETEGE